jgi:hypothetical protein
MTELVMIQAVVFLLLFLALLLIFITRVRAGYRPGLRYIPAFEVIKGFTGRAIEAGRSLHLGLGIGSVANQTTADTLAGLSVLNYLADQGAVTGVPPTVSMADPTVMLMAQNVLRAAYNNDPQGAEMAYRHVRWIAPQPVAYAAGVMALLNIDDVEANVMVGNFGDEYLLMGEVAARQRMAHVGGTSNPDTLPFIYVSAQETLLGEEIYAAGAYLQRRPSQIGSLLTQDTMRWLITTIILGGVLWATVGGFQ